MRRPEDRVSRFLQLCDGETHKEAGIIRAEETHFFFAPSGDSGIAFTPFIDACQNPSSAVWVRFRH
jgi:hypothetical protein